MSAAVASTLDLSLYLVTDTSIAQAAGHTVPEVVAAGVTGGVTTVQVRAKDAPAADFLTLVGEVAAVLPAHVTLVVNDRVDVFLAARDLGWKVDGVHVGQDDLPVERVRRLLGDEAVLGLSASTAEQLRAAGDSPARVDYVGIGALHGTPTKPDAPEPLGIDRMLALAAGSPVPAVAIGGVRVEDAEALRGSDLSGIAVVSGICGATDPAAAAAAYVSAWGAA